MGVQSIVVGCVVTSSYKVEDDINGITDNLWVWAVKQTKKTLIWMLLVYDKYKLMTSWGCQPEECTEICTCDLIQITSHEYVNQSIWNTCFDCMFPTIIKGPCIKHLHKHHAITLLLHKNILLLSIGSFKWNFKIGCYWFH